MTCKILVFSTCRVEKPAALFMYSDVIKGRKKINKCKELKNKWNCVVSKAIVDMVIINISLGIKHQLLTL
jgi:hypothetical protein